MILNVIFETLWLIVKIYEGIILIRNYDLLTYMSSNLGHREGILFVN